MWQDQAKILYSDTSISSERTQALAESLMLGLLPYVFQLLVFNRFLWIIEPLFNILFLLLEVKLLY